MYKVFKIDDSFNSYAISYVYVSGDSVEDVLNHLNNIFIRPNKILHREDWMTDEDWRWTTENGKYKEGDIIYNNYFTEDQIQEIKTSLNEGRFPRIQEIPNMFSDIKYKILDNMSYYE